MQTVDFIGYKREDMSKSAINQIREEGNVPCVLYGAEDHVHFHTPAYLINKLVNTSEVYYVMVDIEGKEYRCILQDVQYHPVSDMILHADFRELTAGSVVKMEIPVKLIGTAPGVVAGGVMVRKRRKITVKALPKDMPQEIELDVSELELGKSLKIKDLHVENGEILIPERITVVSVEVPRGLKALQAEEEAAAAEAEAAELAAEEGEGTEGGEAASEAGDKDGDAKAPDTPDSDEKPSGDS
jgi:large subunit ribosomal protein L25